MRTRRVHRAFGATCALDRAFERRFHQRVLVARVGQIVMVADHRGRYIGAAIGDTLIIAGETTMELVPWRKQLTLSKRVQGPNGRFTGVA